MSRFKTWKAFRLFEHEVRMKRRFIRSRRTEEFLSALRKTCADRVWKIPNDVSLWRAQIGSSWRRINNKLAPTPHSHERMVPLKNRAVEGRANPKGIPVLYLATTAEAAMSEIRPWLDSYVSLGVFTTLRPIRIIDCSLYHAEKNGITLDTPPTKDWDKIVWKDIDQAFACPVTRTDDSSDYVATQIITEFFRSLGFDGIAYKSAFGRSARTIAVFDQDALTLTSCHLHRVTRAKFQFQELNEEYWVLESGPEGCKTVRDLKRASRKYVH